MRIDIVSDVVCPWCIVGYLQLKQALTHSGIQADLRWHPFELNPDLPPDGENLREHITRKYGSSVAESDRNRQRLTALGAELGFRFRFTEQSRIYNSFDAHQLMHWADSFGNKHELKLSLMQAYFTDQLDVSDRHVLAELAAGAGLDRTEALAVLQDQRCAAAVKEAEKTWTSRGIQGVPAIVLEKKYLLIGAQGVEKFRTALEQVETG